MIAPSKSLLHRDDRILLSQREIAKLQGCSRSRIYLIEQRALEKIKRAIIREARSAGQTVHEWLYGADL